MAINDLTGKQIKFEYNGKIRLFVVDKVNETCDTIVGWQIEGEKRIGRQFTFSKMVSIEVL